MRGITVIKPIFGLLVLLLLHHTVCLGAEETAEDKEGAVNDGQSEEAGTEQKALSPLEIYRRLLKEKRKEHRKAVTKIAKMEQYEKQYELVQKTFEKMHKVITDSKVILTESGYMPGDPMPTEPESRDAFSFVLENTGFFGDILLKLPDMTHAILKKKKQWDLIFRWAVGFCTDTGVLDTKDSRILNLVAQELGVIEKDPNYTNPYKKTAPTGNKDKEVGVKNIEKILAEKMAEFNKKMQKDGKGGPKLSRLQHNEL